MLRPIRSRPAAFLALLLAAASCVGRKPGEDAPGAGGAATEWAGLRIEWTLVASSDARLRVLATVTNVTDRPLVRELPWCPNRLVLYRDAQVIWDRAGSEACAGSRRLRLSPGESRSFRTLLAAGRILGDSLSAGEVLVRVHLARGESPDLPRAKMEFTLGKKALRPE